MKKLIYALLLCASTLFGADEFRTATMTVTNGTLTNSSLTLLGTTRLGFTNRAATTFLTNASPMWATTNIFSQLGGWPIAGVLVSNVNSNVLVFKGVNLTVTITNIGLLATNFAGLTWATNTLGANQWNVMLPFDDFPLGRRQTNASQIAYGLNNYATNKVAMLYSNQWMRSNQMDGGWWTNGLATNMVTVQATNVFAGQLTASSGTLSNVALTNVPWMSAKNAYMTNEITVNGRATNMAGSFDAPLMFSHGATGVGYEPIITNTAAGSVGLSFDASDLSVQCGMLFRWFGVAAWGIAVGTNDFSIFGPGGLNLISMEDTILYLGEAGTTVQPQAPFIGLINSNTVTRGTNSINAEVSDVPRTYSTAISGYASAINLGTNYTIKVTGATAAITNASFKGGYSGLRVRVQFTNPGLSCVLLDHSAIGAPASTEKINTGTGALINMTNNPAVFTLYHDGVEWIVDSFSR